jgi:hypothetical protein
MLKVISFSLILLLSLTTRTSVWKIKGLLKKGDGLC